MIGRILPNYIYNILITKDGGKTWNRHSSPSIACITFLDTLNGFAGGDNSIYSTTDGGVNWQTMHVEPSRGFGIIDIFFIDRKNGWAVGGSSVFDSGVILHTIDSGKTWQFYDNLTDIGRAVYFIDSLNGYIVGSNPPFFNGVIKVTSDGGSSWLTHYLSGTWLNDIIFTDDSTGWVVGDYGFIWHTTNRGLNWTKVESNTTSNLYKIFFFNEGKTGYILGANRTLLKYDKIVDVKEKNNPIELSFKLCQNYPNPFNSATQIEFQIPERELVSLTIYDLFGKEVITLLEEEKKPGNYTVIWDAKDKFGNVVSSGIYFYRLNSISMSQTRKLIFIK